MSAELENRFAEMAIRVRNFCLRIKSGVVNTIYIKQLVRSSSSIGANYIEASDDLGKADEKMKIKIARREAKETSFWLQMILVEDDKLLEKERLQLLDEAEQIRKILSAILIKLN